MAHTLVIRDREGRATREEKVEQEVLDGAGGSVMPLAAGEEVDWEASYWRLLAAIRNVEPAVGAVH